MSDLPQAGRGRGRGRGSRPLGPPPGPPPRPPGSELGAIPKTSRPPVRPLPPPPPKREMEQLSIQETSAISSSSSSGLTASSAGIAGGADPMRLPIPRNVSPVSSESSAVTGPEKKIRELDDFSLSGSGTNKSQDLTGVSSTKSVKDESSSIEETPKLYRGTEGKQLDLNSNYLRIDIEEGKGIFEYEVAFNPQIDNRNMRFKLLNQHRDIVGPEKSFDGTKLYLPVKLTLKSTSAIATNPETGESVTISINFKRQKPAGDHSIVQFFNILFNRIFRELKFTQHLRKNFDAQAAHPIPQYKLEIWPGYVTAVDYYEGGLLLQIDVSHRVLRTQTVLDVLAELHKRFGLERLKGEAEKELLGANILTKYNNKSYRIDELDFEANPMMTFTNSKGDEISYLDYYKNQYGIDIKDKKQPLLLSRHKSKMVGEEGVEKIICLVPELCMMTGMTEQMRADYKVMKAVSDITRVTPEQRRLEMENFVKRLMASEVASKMLSNWGLKLKSTPILLKGRVLPPERIFFGNKYSEMVGPRGDWGRAATTKQCLTPIRLHKWAVVFPQKDGKVCQNFCSQMQQFGPRIGIQIAQPLIKAVENDRTETYLNAIRPLVTPTTQMIMIVVPAMKADRYAAIKKLLCVEKAVPSQVIVTKTIMNEKRLSSVAQKVVLQMNCKVGGELWSCQAPFKDIMVVGIDVFHDKSRKLGSIAGIVTSLNDHMTRFHSSVAIQKQGQEIVDALRSGFAEALAKYWEVNQRWPQHIVVFRDGVGDGQLETTRLHEVTQFISTFRIMRNSAQIDARLKGILPEKYDPGFNFIVVQKRINTRLFKAGGKFENPPAGTVMDHTITRYSLADFFLIPQNVNLGTVSPTHYIVLEEAGSKPLSANQVQRLAYSLCHLYYNWPGTVRVPAPCQYAHKLVDLVGENIKQLPSPQLNDKLYFL